MNKKLLIAGLSVILILLLGVSYAFYSYYKISTKSHEIITGSLYVKYTEEVDTLNLNNAFPMSKEEAINQEDNYIIFTITGKNTSTKRELYYQIILYHGIDLVDKIRLYDCDIMFQLSEIIDGTENILIDEMNYDNIDGAVFYTGTIPKGTNSEVSHTYKLRMWINENVAISNVLQDAHYTQGSFNKSFATVKIGIKGNDGKEIYGIKRATNSTSTIWTRTNSGVNLVANAQIGTELIQNDFDDIYPWSEIKSYNYNTSTNTITAWYGDANFKFDGSNGEVMTYIPAFYYQRKQIGGYEYINISEENFAGSTKSEAFSVGRYLASYNENALHSISNSIPANNTTLINMDTARGYARNLGVNFGLMDYHYFIIQLLYLVEYADYDSQMKLGYGINDIGNMQYQSLLVEQDTKRIVVGAPEEYFFVGEEIDINTFGGAEVVRDYNRTITAINPYNDGNVTGYELILNDNGNSFDTHNLVSINPSSTQNSGELDTLGMKSGCLINDYKHSVIYRGIEDVFGNNTITLDGITVYDGYLYVNYNPSTYMYNHYDGDYHRLSYANATTVGYIISFGYDSDNPLISGVTSTYGPSDEGVYDLSIKDWYYRGLAVPTALNIMGGSDNKEKGGMWAYVQSYGSGLPKVTRLIKYN